MARDLVAGNDEGSGSRKRNVGGTVAATLGAPCGNSVVHGVLVAVDEQVLERACDGDGALVVGVASSRY